MVVPAAVIAIGAAACSENTKTEEMLAPTKDPMPVLEGSILSAVPEPARALVVAANDALANSKKIEDAKALAQGLSLQMDVLKNNPEWGQALEAAATNEKAKAELLKQVQKEHGDKGVEVVKYVLSQYMDTPEERTMSTFTAEILAVDVAYMSPEADPPHLLLERYQKTRLQVEKWAPQPAEPDAQGKTTPSKTEEGRLALLLQLDERISRLENHIQEKRQAALSAPPLPVGMSEGSD